MAPKQEASAKAAPKAAPKAKAEAKKAEPKKEEPKKEEPKKEEPKEEEPAKEEAPKDVEAKEEEKKEAGEDAQMEAPAEEAKPEEPQELEGDAAPSKGAKVSAVTFHTEDTTINVMPIVNGKLLMALSDGGFQYLLAGARANVGVKAGRYMFEVAVAELKGASEPAGARSQGPKPKQLVRVGVATADASLLLGDGQEGAGFDSEGFFFCGRQRSKVSQKFGHNQVAAVVLNLDASSPNANTISLFVDGKRASKPMTLPEHLLGKALFPAVTYRNATLQVHFGPQPLRPLPFVCHTLKEAVVADAEVRAAAPAPKDGKYEVVVPVGLPDEGAFDWVDQFLQKNKGYTELSDRSILEWAAKSGLQRQGGYAKRSSNDKPEYNFGLPLMDDLSVNRVLSAVAPALQRNFVVMEVKNNLLSEERKATVARFSGHKAVARVMVGEPSAQYKQGVQDAILADKKSKAISEIRRKKAEAARKKAEEERKKKAEEERKKKAEALKKLKAGNKEGEEAAEAEQEAEDAKMEEAEAKAEEPAETEEDVKVELTDEEKALWFRKRETPDLTAKDLASSFTKFSLPQADEGFASITYEWEQEAKAAEYLEKWVQERKLTQRVEDLQPSEWFKGKWSEWTKLLGQWKKRQQELKDPAKRKAAALAKKKELEAKKKEKTEGEEDVEMAEEPKEINVEDLDVFSVEDVMDIGNGEPLFMNFMFEDWTLCSLRAELHLLAHAFRKDLNDPERPAFHETHLPFYYNKYFKKPLNVKYFGVSKVAELVEMVKDAVQINKANSTLETHLEEDTPVENFVKLAEDHRRDRQRRVDAGDETASLKFTRPAPVAPKQPQQPAKGAAQPALPASSSASRGSSYGARTGSAQQSQRGSGHYSGSAASRGSYGQQPAQGQKRPQPYGGYGSYPPAKHPRPSSYDRDSRGSGYSQGGSWRGGYSRY